MLKVLRCAIYVGISGFQCIRNVPCDYATSGFQCDYAASGFMELELV